MSKNTRTRILLTAVAALLLVTMAVGGTMAWLTAKSSEVENTFTATKLEIDLTETDDPWTQKLLPGATYDKDPKVTVLTDSEAGWLFVEIVEENNDLANPAGDDTKKVRYAVADGWVKLDVTGKKGGTVYLYQPAPKTAGQSVYVLSGNTNGRVEVSDLVVEADMDKLPSLTFYAYAVQSENLNIGGTDIAANNVVANAAAIWALTPAAN